LSSEIDNYLTVEPALHILHVEDNDDDAILVREFVSTQSKLERVSTLTEAVKRLILPTTGPEIDIILLDLGLPDSTSRRDTLNEILQLTNGRPVVVLTSEDDSEAGLQAVRDGAEDYISKNQIISPNYLNQSLSYAYTRSKRAEKEDLSKGISGFRVVENSLKPDVSAPLRNRDSRRYQALTLEYRHFLQTLLKNSVIDETDIDSFITTVSKSSVEVGDLVDIHATALNSFPMITAKSNNDAVKRSRELLLSLMSRIWATPAKE